MAELKSRSSPHSESQDFTAHPVLWGGGAREGAGEFSTSHVDPGMLPPAWRKGPHLVPETNMGWGLPKTKMGPLEERNVLLRTQFILRPNFPLQERKMFINSASLQSDRERWDSGWEVRKDRGGHLFGDFVSLHSPGVRKFLPPHCNLLGKSSQDTFLMWNVCMSPWAQRLTAFITSDFTERPKGTCAIYILPCGDRSQQGVTLDWGKQAQGPQ